MTKIATEEEIVLETLNCERAEGIITKCTTLGLDYVSMSIINEVEHCTNEALVKFVEKF